jgi:hypothetical protein
MDPPCFGTFQYTFHLLRLCLGFADQTKIINFSPMDLILRLFHALPISSESCGLRGLRCVFWSLEAGGWRLGNIHLMTWARINKPFSGGWFMIGFPLQMGLDQNLRARNFVWMMICFFNHPLRRPLTYFYPYFIWITLDIFGYIYIYILMINCFDGTGLPCHQNW